MTIIDVHKSFGLAPQPTDDASRIVIIESGKQVAGFLVDSVAEAEMVNVATDQIEMASAAEQWGEVAPTQTARRWTDLEEIRPMSSYPVRCTTRMNRN